MATIQQLHDLVALNETQQSSTDRITGAEIRAVDNAIIDSVAGRGIIQAANTAALAAISRTESYNANILGDAIYSIIAGTIPDGITTFPSADAGYLWKKVANISVATNPAGLNTQVQFNDSGVFGADAALVYDKTLKLLSVGSPTNGGLVIIGQNGNIAAMPTFRLKFASDANAPMAMYCFTVDNMAFALGAWHNGINSIASSSIASFAIQKNGNVLQIAGGIAAAGSPVSLLDVWHIDTLGNIMHAGGGGGYVYGRNTPSISCAAIEIDSIYKSLVLSRVTTAERNANVFPPVGGTMLYDKTVNKVSIYNGTAWIYLTDSNTGLNTQIIFNDGGAMAGNVGLTYDKISQIFYVGSNMGRMIITGTDSSISNFPVLRLKFASDANAPLTAMAYSQDNVAVTFAMWHNGSNWISGSAAGNFMLVKQNDHIGYMAASGIAAGSIVTQSDIWFINTGGHVNHPVGSYVFGRATPIALACAAVEIDSITKGFLLPRMTRAQRNTIASPAIGLMIFQTDNLQGIYFYTGAAWLNSTPVQYTPTSGADPTGEVGQVAWDANYVYVKAATTWKRIGLSNVP